MEDEMRPDPAFAGFRLFRADSSGWTPAPGISVFGNPVLENPRGDAWEVRLPDGAPEQLFTYAAAVRELAAAGLGFPSAAELEASAVPPDIRKGDGTAPYPAFSGFRHARDRAFYDSGAAAYRWTDCARDFEKRRRTYLAVSTRSGAFRTVRLPSGAAAPVAVRARRGGAAP